MRAKGWTLASLGNVAELYQGFGFPKHLQGRGSGDLGFYKVSDISRAVAAGNEVLGPAAHYISQREADGLRAKPLPKNSVVLARIGEAIKLNRRALLSSDALIDNNVIGLKALLGISDRYLFYFLKTVKLGDLSQATTVPAVRTSDIAAITLPVAPSNEQVRIVSKLDELFSRIDEGERALERVQKLVERYRQSVLKAAVTGELTREWREKNKDKLESGEALLARILKSRREGWEKTELAKSKAKGITPANDKWKQKYEEPSPPDMSDLPKLPYGWVWASVSQIGSTFTGNTPPTSQGDLFGGDIPFLKPTDLEQGYEVRTYRQALTKKGAAFCDLLPAMSTLVTCIGATIGKVGLARVQCATNQQINSLVTDPLIFDPRFIYWLFASPHGQRQVIDNSSSTTLPILNKSRFEALPMPIAPMPEQVRIVDFIEQRLNTVSLLKRDIELEAHRSYALRQVVLRAAFGGQLVPQDPADEPAVALLQRIAAERVTASASPKRGRKPKTTSGS